jgi:RNA polymerase sigma-70 factor (ECF subfamily)
LTKQHSNHADDEKALMQRIAIGDEAAFEALYDRYSRLLYSLLLSVVKHPPEAQDLLQEVFLHIWRQAKNFDAGRGNVYSWLVTMTRHRAIDRLRSKGFRERQQELHDDDSVLMLPDSALSPLDSITVMEQRERVRDALDKIPSEQRDALMLAYFQGYTQTEIATLLQIPLGTIKTRMRQGLLKLSALLQPSL